MANQMEVLSEKLGPPVVESFLPEGSPPASSEGASQASDSPSSQATRKARATWPIRIFKVDQEKPGTLHLMPDSPSFNEAIDAEKWQKANTPIGEALIGVRVPAEALKSKVTQERVPWP